MFGTCFSTNFPFALLFLRWKKFCIFYLFVKMFVSRLGVVYIVLCIFNGLSVFMSGSYMRYAILFFTCNFPPFLIVITRFALILVNGQFLGIFVSVISWKFYNPPQSLSSESKFAHRTNFFISDKKRNNETAKIFKSFEKFLYSFIYANDHFPILSTPFKHFAINVSQNISIFFFQCRHLRSDKRKVNICTVKMWTI